jgi:hypothetical protein
VRRPCIFGAFSWLYCRSNIGYQAAAKSRSRRISRGESRATARRPKDAQARTVRGKKDKIEWFIGLHWGGR